MYKKDSHRVGFALTPGEYECILAIKNKHNLESVASTFHFLLDFYMNPVFPLSFSGFDSGISFGSVRSVENRFSFKEFFSSIFHRGRK